MFQIGSLVVFCGLLAQATAQLAGLPMPLGQGLNLPKDYCLSLPQGHGLPLPQDHCLSLPQGQSLSLAMTSTMPIATYQLAGSFTDAFSNALLSRGLFGFLENIPLLNILRSGGGNYGGLIGGLLGRVTSWIPFLNSIVDLKITDPQLLELGLVQSLDRHRLYVTIPLGFKLKVNTLLVGSLLDMAVKLNVTAEVLAVRDYQWRSHLVIGDCTHSPGSLHISILNGVTPLQNLLDSLIGILTNVLPALVQGTVCPLVNGILSLLDVTLAHDIADLLIRGVQFVIKV